MLNFVLLFFTTFLLAQTPQAICFQAIAIDANGDNLENKPVGIRLSVMAGSPNGNDVYVETHSNIITDNTGLFTVDLGKGTAISVEQFHKIQWGMNRYFLKAELDLSGGTNYVHYQTTQLISVPYSLYAYSAGKAMKADTAAYAKTAAVAKVVEKIQNDKDTDPTNELQSIAFSNGVLTISPAPLGGGGAVQIQDSDGDPTNEIQDIQFNQQTGELMLVSPKGINPANINIYEGLFKYPASSFDYPLGVLGAYKNIGEGNYTVPAGKILFVTAGPESFKLSGFGSGDVIHRRLPSFPVFKAGTVIKSCKCTGFLANDKGLISAESIDLKINPVYQVPTGKDLVIKSGLATDGYLVVNDVIYQFLETPTLSGTIIFPEGTLIKQVPGTLDHLVLTGYLMPHNKD